GAAEARPGLRGQIRLRRHRVEQARGNVHCPQRVRVAGVGRSGKRQIAETELLHLAQTLKEAVVDHRLLTLVDGNGPVYRVADSHEARLNIPQTSHPGTGS